MQSILKGYRNKIIDEQVKARIGTIEDHNILWGTEDEQEWLTLSFTDANTLFVDANASSDGAGTESDPMKYLRTAVNSPSTGKSYILIKSDFLQPDDYVQITDNTPNGRVIYAGYPSKATKITHNPEYRLEFVNYAPITEYVYSVTDDDEFQALGGNFYLARSSDYIEYSADGFNFTTSASIGFNINSIFAGLGYLFACTENGIYRTTNLSSWTLVGGSGLNVKIGMTWRNSQGLTAYFACHSNIVRRSTNSTDWTTIATIGTAGGTITKITKNANNTEYWYFEYQGSIYKIDREGNNSKVAESPTGYNLKYLEYLDGKVYAFYTKSTYGCYIYCYNPALNSFTLVFNGTASSQNLNNSGFGVYNNAIYFVTGNRYIFRFDGNTVIQAGRRISGLTIGNFSTISHFKGMFYLPNTNFGVARYYPSLIINNSNYVYSYYGLEFSGNGISEYGITDYTDVFSSSTVNNCSFNGFNNYAVVFQKSLSATNKIEKSIIKNCENGTSSDESLENLYININNTAIKCKKARYNTIDNAKTPVIPKSSTIDEIKYNIFSNIKQLNEATIFYKNLIHPINTNIDLLENLSGFANFKNKDGIITGIQDYRLVFKDVLANNGKPYYFSSLGVEYSDDTITSDIYDGEKQRDIGCYNIRRDIESDLYKYQIIMDDFLANLTQSSIELANTREFLSISGLYTPSFIGESAQISILWRAYNKEQARDIFTLFKILKNPKPNRFYINCEDFFNLWTDNFSSIGETNNFRNLRDNGHLGIYSSTGNGNDCVLNLVDLTLCLENAGFKPDEFKGWIVHISFMKDSSPFKFIGLWFKIYENDENTLYLDNIDNTYLNELADSYDSNTDYLGFTIIAMDTRWKQGSTPFRISDLISRSMQYNLPEMEFTLLEA